MGANARPEGHDDRVASLEAQVAELLGAVRSLTAEVAELRAARGPAAARAAELTGRATEPVPNVLPADASPASSADGAGIGRRRLLLGGGAAAAAATAAVVAGSATPAAAANGGALIMGVDTNTSTATTLWSPTTNGEDAGLSISQQGSGPALRASTSSSTAIIGVSASGLGVTGTSGTSDGVSGFSTSGYGLVGVSNTSDGVYAQSETARGVVGLSAQNTGVFGTGVIGIFGEGSVGVEAYSSAVNLRLTSPDEREAPTGDSTFHRRGDLVLDGEGDVWVCVAEGTPGTWRKLSGPESAGTFHLLANPVRVYDSRPGTTPAVGSKTKLTGNTARLLSVTANSSGVPLGATAVAVTLLLVNASSAGGNFTIWAGGAPRPSANAMVWGGTAGRFASTATTRISATGTVNVAASSSTDLALDIVGYYR